MCMARCAAVGGCRDGGGTSILSSSIDGGCIVQEAGRKALS